jgi:hypothetical protein
MSDVGKNLTLAFRIELQQLLWMKSNGARFQASAVCGWVKK